MTEEKKTQVITTDDEESAYPGTVSNFDVKKVIENVKKCGKTDHFTLSWWIRSYVHYSISCIS